MHDDDPTITLIERRREELRLALDDESDAHDLYAQWRTRGTPWVEVARAEIAAAADRVGLARRSLAAAEAVHVMVGGVPS